MSETVKQAEEILKELHIDSKFMKDFDPEKSERSSKKKGQKISKVQYFESPKKSSSHVNKTAKRIRKSKSTALYDDKGRIMGKNIDLCDCCNSECCGCFFPCSKCKSTKCGQICRVKRRFFFSNSIDQLTGNVIKNPYTDDFRSIIHS